MIFLNSNYIFEEFTSSCGTTFNKHSGIETEITSVIARLLVNKVLIQVKEIKPKKVEIKKVEIKKVEPKKVEVKKVETKAKKGFFDLIKYTSKELFKLVKKQQIKLIRKLGCKDSPKYEADRVDLILKLQKGKK